MRHYSDTHIPRGQHPSRWCMCTYQKSPRIRRFHSQLPKGPIRIPKVKNYFTNKYCATWPNSQLCGSESASSAECPRMALYRCQCRLNSIKCALTEHSQRNSPDTASYFRHWTYRSRRHMISRWMTVSNIVSDSTKERKQYLPWHGWPFAQPCCSSRIGSDCRH